MSARYFAQLREVIQKLDRERNPDRSVEIDMVRLPKRVGRNEPVITVPELMKIHRRRSGSGSGSGRQQMKVGWDMKIDGSVIETLVDIVDNRRRNPSDGRRYLALAALKEYIIGALVIYAKVKKSKNMMISVHEFLDFKSWITSDKRKINAVIKVIKRFRNRRTKKTTKLISLATVKQRFWELLLVLRFFKENKGDLIKKMMEANNSIGKSAKKRRKKKRGPAIEWIALKKHCQTSIKKLLKEKKKLSPKRTELLLRYQLFFHLLMDAVPRRAEDWSDLTFVKQLPRNKVGNYVVGVKKNNNYTIKRLVIMKFKTAKNKRSGRIGDNLDVHKIDFERSAWSLKNIDGKSIKIFNPKPIRDALKQYLRIRKTKYNESIWPWKDGTLISGKVFSAYEAMCPLEGRIGVDVLRHSFATMITNRFDLNDTVMSEIVNLFGEAGDFFNSTYIHKTSRAPRCG